MKSSIWFVAACAVVLAGCAKKEEPLPNTEQGDGPTVSSNAPTDDPKKPSTPGSKDKPNPMQQFIDEVPAKPKGIEPAQKGRDGWLASKNKAADVLKTVESKMRELNGISAQTLTTVEFKGGWGQKVGQASIDKGGKFRIEYATLVTDPVPNVSGDVIIFDGNSFVQGNPATGWGAAKPASQLKKVSEQDLARWTTDFPAAIFSVYAGATPLSDLLAKAQRDGMDITLEERIVDMQNLPVSQKRILMSRNAEKAKKQGKFDLEIIVDSRLMLPVTVRTSREPLDDTPTRLMWTIIWNLKPDQKFATDEFSIPAQKA